MEPEFSRVLLAAGKLLLQLGNPGGEALVFLGLVDEELEQVHTIQFSYFFIRHGGVSCL